MNKLILTIAFLLTGKESLPIVDQIYELMKIDLALKISIEGHTDNIGEAVSNKKLSDRRVEIVKKP